MMAINVQELVARIALNSDAGAYRELFLHYYPKLLHFSVSITHSRESSEEAVSDVFMAVWNLRSTLLRISNFHLYLYISTKNTSLNYRARQRRTQAFSLDDVRTDFASLSGNPEQQLITAEMFRRMTAAIQTLPPRCRLVFKLVKEDNLRYREVAELLHLSVKTVEAQMAIAVRKLGEAVALQKKIFRP